MTDNSAPRITPGTTNDVPSLNDDIDENDVDEDDCDVAEDDVDVDEDDVDVDEDDVDVDEDDIDEDDVDKDDVDKELDKSRFDIFISYRVNPDERKASALKRLLRKTITPEPRIFACSLGGLQASSLGFREQIADAVRTASAMLAVVTHSSKNREWLFYEAGAAFGRGVLYAPLMFNISPSELPSTIGGYQAFDASSKEQMKRFTGEIALTLGSELRPRFGTHFATFRRALKERATRPADGVDDLAKTMKLALGGRADKAEKGFDKMIKDADDEEERILVEFSRLLTREGSELPLECEKLCTRFPGTTISSYILGYTKISPQAREQHFRSFLAQSEHLYQSRSCRVAERTAHLINQAQVGLFRSQVDAGHPRLALNELLSWLLSESGPTNKWAIIKSTEGLLPDPPLIEKTLLALLAPRFSNAGFCLRLIDSLADFLPVVALAAINMAEKHAVSSPSIELQRGRCLATLSLDSLAFRSYRKSSEGGITVSLSNMAGLATHSALPEVGLEILRAHTGEFDAASASGPHRVRAEAEALLEAEEKKCKEKTALGMSILYALIDFMRGYRPNPDPERPGKRYSISTDSSSHLTYIPDGDEVKLVRSDDGQPLILSRLPHLDSIFFTETAERFSLADTGSGTPRCLCASFADGEPSVRWLSLGEWEEVETVETKDEEMTHD